MFFGYFSLCWEETVERDRKYEGRERGITWNQGPQLDSHHGNCDYMVYILPIQLPRRPKYYNLIIPNQQFNFTLTHLQIVLVVCHYLCLCLLRASFPPSINMFLIQYVECIQIWFTMLLINSHSQSNTVLILAKTLTVNISSCSFSIHLSCHKQFDKYVAPWAARCVLYVDYWDISLKHHSW